MSELRVESLHTYPIKSCAGTSLESVDITERGLADDRVFMLIDRDGNFVSQRTKPQLAVVTPNILYSDPLGTIDMDISAPGMSRLITGHEQGLPEVDDPVEAYVHGNPVPSLLVDHEADAWFSAYLDMPVRLVAVDRHRSRLIKDRYRQADSTNKVGFADAFQITLAGQASLDALNEAIAEGTGASAILMDRFRPNIVVSGEDLEPYEEDYWRRIRIGRMLAYVVRPSKRCAIPYVDQETGQSTGNKTVGKTLALTRRGRDTTKPDSDDKGVYFAQNLALVYEEGLRINTGDQVEVLEHGPDSNVELRSR